MSEPRTANRTELIEEALPPPPATPVQALNKLAEQTAIGFQVRVIKREIMLRASRQTFVSMSDIYEDKALQPKDGDMYDAFRELLAEGKLAGPPVDSVPDHDIAKYRLPRPIMMGRIESALHSAEEAQRRFKEHVDKGLVISALEWRAEAAVEGQLVREDLKEFLEACKHPNRFCDSVADIINDKLRRLNDKLRRGIWEHTSTNAMRNVVQMFEANTVLELIHIYETTLEWESQARARNYKTYIIDHAMQHTTHINGRVWHVDLLNIGAPEKAVNAAVAEMLTEGTFVALTNDTGALFYCRRPKVGDKATLRRGSDSYAYDIVKVSPSGKTFTMKRDNSELTARQTKDAQSFTFKADGCWVTPGLDLTKMSQEF